MSKPRLPKKKCCVSSSRCKRCPIRMLRDGTLPAGYTVKKRKLVQVEGVVPVATAAKTTKLGKKTKKQRKKEKRAKVPIAA